MRILPDNQFGARIRDSWFLTFAILILTIYAYRYLHHSALPQSAELGSGWWSWWDQSHYYKAVQAWVAGDFSAANHWYLSGYPLIGAAFYWLAPAHPFFVPNAAALLLSLYLFAEIAAEFGVGKWAASTIFTATLVVPAAVFEGIVVPWTTTPVQPLIYTIILAALRNDSKPDLKWPAIVGVCSGLITFFRPTDIVILVPVAIFALSTAVRRRDLRHLFRVVVVFCICFGAITLVSVLSHVAIHGFQKSQYMIAGNADFDFMAVKNKFVSLFLDPQTLYPGPNWRSHAILHYYPWIAIGLIGSLYFAVFKRLRLHLFVISVMFVYLILYMAYGDFRPTELWGHRLIHYVIWTFPFFGLFGVLALLDILDRKNWLPLAAAIALCAIALCLHVQISPLSGVDISRKGQQLILSVPTGSFTLGTLDIPLVKGSEPHKFDRVYRLKSRLGSSETTRVIGAVETAFGDRLAFEAPVEANEITIEMPADARVSSTVSPVPFSLSYQFGFPCWLREDECPAFLGTLPPMAAE